MIQGTVNKGSAFGLMMAAAIGILFQTSTASATGSMQCGGLALFIDNFCPGRLQYVHICYGLNGSLGAGNLVVHPGEQIQQHVQKFTRVNVACDQPAPTTCPGQIELTIIRCEGQ